MPRRNARWVAERMKALRKKAPHQDDSPPAEPRGHHRRARGPPAAACRRRRRCARRRCVRAQRRARVRPTRPGRAPRRHPGLGVGRARRAARLVPPDPRLARRVLAARRQAVPLPARPWSARVARRGNAALAGRAAADAESAAVRRVRRRGTAGARRRPEPRRAIHDRLGRAAARVPRRHPHDPRHEPSLRRTDTGRLVLERAGHADPRRARLDASPDRHRDPRRRPDGRPVRAARARGARRHDRVRLRRPDRALFGTDDAVPLPWRRNGHKAVLPYGWRLPALGPAGELLLGDLQRHPDRAPACPPRGRPGLHGDAAPGAHRPALHVRPAERHARLRSSRPS